MFIEERNHVPSPFQGEKTYHLVSYHALCSRTLTLVLPKLLRHEHPSVFSIVSFAAASLAEPQRPRDFIKLWRHVHVPAQGGKSQTYSVKPLT